jgi:hypothetical protein
VTPEGIVEQVAASLWPASSSAEFWRRGDVFAIAVRTPIGCTGQLVPRELARDELRALGVPERATAAFLSEPVVCGRIGLLVLDLVDRRLWLGSTRRTPSRGAA